jgi:hypothetical protein
MQRQFTHYALKPAHNYDTHAVLKSCTELIDEPTLGILLFVGFDGLLLLMMGSYHVKDRFNTYYVSHCKHIVKKLSIRLKGFRLKAFRLDNTRKHGIQFFFLT